MARKHYPSRRPRARRSRKNPLYTESINRFRIIPKWTGEPAREVLARIYVDYEYGGVSDEKGNSIAVFNFGEHGKKRINLTYFGLVDGVPRRAGIGKRAFENLEDHFHDQGFTRITLQNVIASAEPFWKYMGFSPTQKPHEWAKEI